ncbi:D-alanyl-D-alanine carboxypeptidase [Streptomyces sp. WAC04114]|uniref:D-alanyl-D-alanine carboxypeptidase n=1 Tax=Streptomyces sp. WAC04114 TaxID=2867961 RepID=UPI0027E09EE5|nr:D-alanyl-D-alanine carboxypeptidase [Streptomyces sp. WAC04114]
MAGESPDRSKQRESSARETSGSASPVPEARSEAAADPRLAVARDAEKSAARGGADTATRVLSTRTAETPGNTGRSAGDPKPENDAGRAEGDSDTKSTAADADAEKAEGNSGTKSAAGDAGRAAADADAERTEHDSDAKSAARNAGRTAGDADAEGTEDDSGTKSAAGDAGRVTGDADTEGTKDDSDTKSTAADADAERTEGASGTKSAARNAGRTAGDADAERAEGDSGTEGAADGAAGNSGRSGDGSTAEETEEAAADAGEGASGSSVGSEESGADKAAADAEGTDGRLRDVVAAWVASADGGEESAAAKGGAKGAREAAERTDEPAEADTDAHQEAGKAAGASQTPSDAGNADNGADDSHRREAGRDEVARGAADEADAPEADRSAKGGSTGTAEAAEKTDDKASEPADPRVSGDAEPESKAPAARTAPKAAAPKTADAKTADAKNDAGATKAPAEGPKSGKPDRTDGSTDDDAPTERPVDQPTAVFKTLRPPVDQPTTMLKLGGAAKDLPKSDLPKKDAPTTDAPKKDAPEKDAERTSKFVALKPLDDPAAKKPVAPAEATAPVPTVGPERTTQQPLPPKPPLDLLAELTNTPPPPETPLRTAARRVKIWTPLVLLLIVVLAVVQSVRPLPSPTLELTAKDSYTFEGGKVDIPWPADGQAALDVQGIGTFGSSGEQKPVPIASVAKVMTAYVILRDHPLKSGEDGPKILIDQAAQDQSDAGQESTVDVTKGDKITQREALESILIASANNVARLLARWDAKSEKAFVQKMNDAAKDLGMKNTTYTDPSGLNNTTVSTAVDQVKLAKAAMLQPAFREVATMMSYVDYKQKKHDNWNRLVGYNNVTGIKTGTTTSALGNLVFAAKKDVNGETHRIIGAVVRQPAGGPDNTILGAALHEGDKLIRAAQGALESATILKKGEVVGYADDGLGGRTPVAVTEDVTAVGWAGLSVKLTFAGDDLPHTAEAGTKVGTLTVGDGTTSAVKVPVALQKDLAEPGFAAKLTRLG